MQEVSLLSEKISEFLKNNPTKLENALYIVATPIGNLGDITIRALEILGSVDYVICEDTRVSSMLLQKFKITKKKLLIYNDFSESKNLAKISQIINDGYSVALISDAGTPLISDPGYRLTNFLRSQNRRIICVPGASSLTAGISISGIACDNFLFLGFLPNNQKQVKDSILKVPSEYSFVIFESPHRVIQTLEIIKSTLPERNVSVVKELTKIYEEVFFGKVDEVLDRLKNNLEKIRGEFVIIVEKELKSQRQISFDVIDSEIKKSLIEGKSIKNIADEFAEIFGINKKQLYKIAIKISENI